MKKLFVLLCCVYMVYAIPHGFSAFFDADACPSGWGQLNVVTGRLVVSTASQDNVGITVNTPLADQEDRTHTHSFSTSIHVPHRDVAAIGCCNNQGAAHGQYPVNNNTLVSASGYPFTQMLLCTYQKNDSLPVAYGTVAYFDPDIGGCPTQWAPMKEADGRILVPGYAQGGSIPNSAPRLSSGEDRTHTHVFSIDFPTTDVSYVGAEGCCDSGPANHEDLNVAATADSVSTGLPYVQLLTCVSQAPTFNQTLPQDALVFNQISCPPGWDVVNEVSGRLLVGLPDNGSPGASFGGNSLNPSGLGNSFHNHGVEGSLTLPSVGVGLASGCCGDGYLGAGSYDYSGTTSQSTADLPYTFLPLCRNSLDKRNFLPEKKQKN
jgi:hypothetical protein